MRLSRNAACYGSDDRYRRIRRINSVACGTLLMTLGIWVYEQLYINLGFVSCIVFFMMMVAPLVSRNKTHDFARAAHRAKQFFRSGLHRPHSHESQRDWGSPTCENDRPLVWALVRCRRPSRA